MTNGVEHPDIKITLELEEGKMLEVLEVLEVLVILHHHIGGRAASAEEMTGWKQPAGSLSILSSQAELKIKIFITFDSAHLSHKNKFISS